MKDYFIFNYICNCMKYNDRLDNWVKNLIYYIKFGYLLILTNIDINHYLVTILVER